MLFFYIFFLKAYNCRCNSTSKFTRNNGGSSVICTRCNLNQVQSSDGWSCVLNQASCDSMGFLTDTNIDGALFLNNTTPTVTSNVIHLQQQLHPDVYHAIHLFLVTRRILQAILSFVLIIVKFQH